ncbi:class III extradiol ring-cleavage dioxygenase [Bacillaceae bacterium]
MVPSLFVCHGAPVLALEKNAYTRFLHHLARTLPRPQALVVFTAHWESETLSLTFTDDEYETIHDFWGFPPELHAMTYPAKGSIRIAGRIHEMLEKEGIPAKKETKRGLDHGSWVILHLMYPEADIPVVQLSVNPELPVKEQYAIGRALQALGEEDILVIGSGATVHNLALLEWGKTTPERWAVEFDDWLIDKLMNWDLEALSAYEQLAPHGRKAVPRSEHLVPLFIAMGCGDGRRRAQLLHRSYAYGSLSHIVLQFLKDGTP